MTFYTPASTPYSQHPWDPFGPNLIIIVGHQGSASETLFKCSASLLCHYSGYFHQLTNSSFFFDPTTITTIRLPNDSPDIFAMTYTFLQSRHFLTPPPQSSPTIPEARHLSFDKITDLYASALARNILLVQNAAADLFAQKIKLDAVLPDAVSTTHLWTSTPPSSPLRRMLVALVREMFLPSRPHYYARAWRHLVDADAETPEMLLAVMQQVPADKVRVSQKMWKKVLGCEWHEHEYGATCEGSEEVRLEVCGEGAYFMPRGGIVEMLPGFADGVVGWDSPTQMGWGAGGGGLAEPDANVFEDCPKNWTTGK